jgi:hypothetical protein
MTVQELINVLNKIENKAQTVKIALHQYNKAYPVAYLDPWNEEYLNQAWEEVRISASLPDNMHTVTRNKPSLIPLITINGGDYKRQSGD